MHRDKEHHWNYSDDDALRPSEWPKYFKTGSSQSPINIIVDYCHLRQHSVGAASGQAQATGLHDQLGRKLNIKGRREHLNSVGDESGDSNHNDSNDDRPNGHHANRSPSTSSHGSNESNTSDGVHSSSTHSKRNHHNHHHHHHHQQHISRQIQNTLYCATNKKIFLGYPRYLNAIKLANTGHGWQVDMPPELASHTILTGPPLGDREYRLAQFHCHWGDSHDNGSEHQVNGQSFSAEIHFVHWNCRQFKSIEEASKHKHGLAVLGVFVQALAGEQNRNKHLDKIIMGLENVRETPHQSTLVGDLRLDLKKLFPSNRWDYATYEGSLTTPPLSECVDWLVFLQPITCSLEQVAHFRRIKCPWGPLAKNCRPVQPLNERTVTIWTHNLDATHG